MQFEKLMVIGKDSDLFAKARELAVTVYSAEDTNEARTILNSVLPDIVLADDTVLCEQGSDMLAAKRIKTFVLTDDPSKTSLYESLKYIKKLDLGNFQTLFTPSQPKNTPADRAEDRFDADQIVKGSSTATKRLSNMLNLVGKSQCNPVLIIGETGTGKEVAAKAIHTIRCPKAPFVAINCAALTSTLLESELFGHLKGSFTGAEKDKTGLLELADDGVVFLDEISEMPLELQAKLLRVLQEKTFRKVGGTKELICKATIIASSNRKLYSEAQQGKFRQDLYYRLAVCPIQILPLRSKERTEDICELALHFLKSSTICPEKVGKITGFTKLAMESLTRYNWPGNVRELKNVVERAVLLETTDKVGLTSLLFNPEMMEEPLCENPTSTSKDFSLEKAEKELIARALQESGWQKTRAAAMLGITRATLYAKVKQYDIRIPETEESLAEMIA